MRRRRQTDGRARLADDARRVSAYADWVVTEAERLGLPTPPIIRWATAIWRAWADLLAETD